MAITPRQAKEERFGNQADEFNYHVSRIDRMLTDGRRTYSCSLFGSEHDLIPRIVEEYRHAGWEVELVDDFRDGDFLQFRG